MENNSPEYALIGAILIDERCLPETRKIIPDAGAFQNAKLAEIYSAACALCDRGEAVDMLTISRRCGLSLDFMKQCADMCTTAANAPVYARQVLEDASRRQLYGLGTEIQSLAENRAVPYEQTLTSLYSQLDQLREDCIRSGPVSSAQSLHDFMAHRQEIDSGISYTLATGFHSLDNVLGGLLKGGLYIIGARPSVGKSAFGIAAADMLARQNTVLFVSLEMTANELNARRAAAHSRLIPSYTRLLHCKLSEAENDDLAQTLARLADRRLHLETEGCRTVAQIGAAAQKCGAQVIVIDYLGLLETGDRRQNEYERITQISRDLKLLAKRLSCVVIALCQLNRDAAGTNEPPQLHQLRSSGAIEQDADAVMLLHRKDYGSPPEPAEEGTAFYVDVAKNRHGRIGTVALKWYRAVNRFLDEGHAGSYTWSDRSWD